MIALQNIDSATHSIIIKRPTQTIEKRADPTRFIHLTEEEYLIVTDNGDTFLTGTDTEDNTSNIWRWTSPLDAFGNPIVPLPVPPEEEPPLPPRPVKPPTGIEDSIQDGVITSAPTQNAVFDALAEKAEWAGGTQRPLNPTLGQMFFDTTLNRPIWWNGTSWLDPLGGQSISGTLTVSGSGQMTIPCSSQPLTYEVHFNDNPVYSGCGNQSEDTVGISVSPSLDLIVTWDITTGIRGIEWSAHLL